MSARAKKKRAPSLAAYREKRDLGRSPEPAGRLSRRRGLRRFVVQKHDAKTLHYDFRLEVGGVLRSWAVPKGPSTDPRERRLAIATEDHPLEYATFEGVIPEGQYGAGSVLVWDRGTYRVHADRRGKARTMARALEAGHAAFELRGQKLRGGYSLSRMGGGGRRERWLLVKSADAKADARRNPVSTQRKSVLSGRSLRRVAQDARRARPAKKK